MAQPCPCHGDSRIWGVEEEIFRGLGLQDHPGPAAVPHPWPHIPPALGLRLLGGKASFHGAAVGLCGVVELSMELGGLCGAVFWAALGSVGKGPCRGEPSPASQALPTPSSLRTLPSQAYSPGVGIRSCGAEGSGQPPTPTLPEGDPTAA